MILTNLIISKLYAIEAIKNGTFTLKSGETSNYYYDMRMCISYPGIYDLFYNLLIDINPTIFDNIDIIAGIHFGGLPFANYLSFKTGIPQIFIRDSIKTYGTSKSIEGTYTPGSTVLLIDDVITSGKSLLEKHKILSDLGFKIKNLVLMDRFHGKVFIDYFSILKHQDVINYNSNNLIYLNKLKNKIFDICYKKKTNIIVSLDFTTTQDIINYIKEIGNYILGIKLHNDIIQNFDSQFIDFLNILKTKFNFIIIEDRKLADIGFIVDKQLKVISSYADYVTVHLISGKNIIDTINKYYPGLGILPVIEMSTSDSLTDEHYIDKCIPLISSDIDGIICQDKTLSKLNNKYYDILTFSPGINLQQNNDNYDQTYKNSKKDLKNTGQFWIVGRGITTSLEPLQIIQKYNKNGFFHFLNY